MDPIRINKKEGSKPIEPKMIAWMVQIGNAPNFPLIVEIDENIGLAKSSLKNRATEVKAKLNHKFKSRENQ